MKEPIFTGGEFWALKFIAGLLAFVILVFLLGACTSIEEEKERVCSVECEKCERVRLTCSHSKDKAGAKITPAG